MFQSLGCPRNWVDTEVMLGILLQNGYEPTQSVSDADYLVLNTCGFLQSARNESQQEIEQLLDEKKNSAKLIVTGCMVNLHKDEILQQYPAVDTVLGAGSIDKILDAVKSLDTMVVGKNNNDTDDREITTAKSFLEDGQVPRVLATPQHYAYLKIAEGCKKRCSFCIIPKIKGPLQSKPQEQVVRECKALLDSGVSEIILIAQDLGDYGKDRQQRQPNNDDDDDGGGSGGGGQLASLLKSILNETKSDDKQQQQQQDYWLRLMYLYPDEITDDVIDIMVDDPRICRYLDMPIQHINDQILRRMRRKTSGDDIRKTIQKLRSRLPGIHIRTSLMVGFPGETDEQFLELLEFVKEARLENVGVFQYSNEELADSSRIQEQVPEDIKQDRFERLMEAQLEVVRSKNKEMIGDLLEVVLEGEHPERSDFLVGRYYGQCPEIDGQVLIDKPRRRSLEVGQRCTIEVTGFHDYDLVGHILDK